MQGRASALVLAAGQGSRFGGGKLHALYRGRPLLSHVLEVVEAACKRGLLTAGPVVTAATDQRTLDLVHDTSLQIVLNDTPAAGLSRSLQLGLAALDRQQTAKAAMIFLGDQPRVRMEVIEQLVEAWRGSRAAMIRPRYALSRDVPGHPVLLGRPLWARALSLHGDDGFGALGPDSRDLVLIELPGDNPDVDTPRDLQALERSSP